MSKPIYAVSPAIPIATTSTIGGVKQGTNITIATDGTISSSGGGSAPNATTSAPGLVQLAGDLGGTAASPTVPGLSSKQATLTSGTNIKTVGGTSLLGSGDVPFPSTSGFLSESSVAQSAISALTNQGATAVPVDGSNIQYLWNGFKYTTAGPPVVGPRSIVVNTWSDIQTAHDTLKTAGGGWIVFNALNTFTATTTISIDTAYVGIKFNRAVVDISGLANGQAGFSFYSSGVIHSFTGYASQIYNYSYDDAYIYGGNPNLRPFSTDTQNTVVAFYLNTTTTDTSNRIQFNNPQIIGCYKAFSVGDGSYVTRVKGGHIIRNFYGVNMESGTLNAAEIFSFDDVLFGENHCHLNDLYGNQWRFYKCHFDYHTDGTIFNVTGTHAIFDGCHFEWNYGEGSVAGATNSPFNFVGAGAEVYINGGKIAFQDKQGTPTWRPLYTAPCTMTLQSQVLEITDVCFVNQGRRNDTTGFDSFVYCSAGAVPSVRIKAHPAGGGLLTDMPSMSLYVDNAAVGVGGILRDGATQPFNETNWRISTTGTAQISTISATDNGVTQKNSQPMLKITGSGKVVICFPVFEPTRRHAWSLFYATASTFTGSATIRQRQGGFAPSFSGTTQTVASQTATISVATPAVVTSTIPVNADDKVYFTTTGTLPTGLTANQIYFVLPGFSAGSFQVSSTPRGTAIATSGAGSGTHTVAMVNPVANDLHWNLDTRGANYAATTITVSTANTSWVRKSWKDVDNQVMPRLYQGIGSTINLEIDTTSMTAGALYLTYIGFDMI